MGKFKRMKCEAADRIAELEKENEMLGRETLHGRRIAELEEQLMSAQNDGFDTAKDEFNEKLRSQDKEIERLRSALTVQIRDMKAFKKVLEDDGGFVNAVLPFLRFKVRVMVFSAPAVQKSIDEMQAALEGVRDE